MKLSIQTLKWYSVLFMIQNLATEATSTAASTRFASHITVNTPARSYSHGVGNPVASARKYPNAVGSHAGFVRKYSQVVSGVAGLRKDPQGFGRMQQWSKFRSLQRPAGQYPSHSRGYPKMTPKIPFTSEDVPQSHSIKVTPWLQNSFMDVSIPVLPPSPYKVDSPDPESLWPEGLFLPPATPLKLGPYARRIGNSGEVVSDSNQINTHIDHLDPYLLEGTDAIAAVKNSRKHGHYYFHDIPHIQSLLENQDLRIENDLEPHRLGSIRLSWPFNRP